jgi:hypothetical protein
LVNATRDGGTCSFLWYNNGTGYKALAQTTYRYWKHRLLLLVTAVLLWVRRSIASFGWFDEGMGYEGDLQKVLLVLLLLAMAVLSYHLS